MDGVAVRDGVKDVQISYIFLSKKLPKSSADRESFFQYCVK